jgi:molecular chaperone GrpE
VSHGFGHDATHDAQRADDPPATQPSELDLEAAEVAEAAKADLADGLDAPDEPADPAALAARERDEYLDALRRLQADFENYKKRVARDVEQLSSRGVTSLVAALLPVIDALDLAEEHLLGEEDASGALASEVRALVQARALLLDTLTKEGLERVGIAGEGFDPQVHDAVAHAEGDDGPVVDEVLRAGYRWRGAMLRPAMVKVRG